MPESTPRLSRLPRCLRDLRTPRPSGEAQTPVSLVAYSLLRCESILKNMCFIDNEHGETKKQEIETLSIRCMQLVNQALEARRHPIRIFSIQPWRKRHHHVEVQWSVIPTADEMNNGNFPDIQVLIANLYLPSKRVQDDEEERVAPRRGEKLKRVPDSKPKTNKKPRRGYDNEREQDARDSGGDSE